MMPMFLSFRVMIDCLVIAQWLAVLVAPVAQASNGDQQDNGQREERCGEDVAASTPRNQGRRSDQDEGICKGRRGRAVAGETRDAPHDGRHYGGLTGLPLLTIVRHINLRFTGECANSAAYIVDQREIVNGRVSV
jgi:hypothetical protein